MHELNARARAVAPGLAIPPARRRGDVATCAPGALSVVVISADPLLRAAWSQGLRRSGAASVDESATLTDARARIAAGAPPDLIVLDSGAGGGPVDSVLIAVSDVPGRIVMVGDPGSVGAVQASLQAGVRGYLFGRIPDPDPRCRTHQLVVEPGCSGNRRGAGSRVLDVHGTSQLLSGREIEILQHAADGETNMQIGDQLELSPLTVKSHFSRIGRRLGSGDRAQLVLLALRGGAIR